MPLRKNTVFMPGQFSQRDYTVVGSWIPLQEYIYTVDIVKQFINDVSEMHDIPRPIQLYDAVTICSEDPPSIGTLLLLPYKYKDHYSKFNAEYFSDINFSLVFRSTPFQSFRHPDWPYGFNSEFLDDDDETTWNV